MEHQFQSTRRLTLVRAKCGEKIPQLIKNQLESGFARVIRSNKGGESRRNFQPSRFLIREWPIVFQGKCCSLHSNQSPSIPVAESPRARYSICWAPVWFKGDDTSTADPETSAGHPALGEDGLVRTRVWCGPQAGTAIVPTPGGGICHCLR
jgi:hypothetical protein